MLRELGQLQAAVRRKRRGLDNQGIASNQRRGDLGASQHDGEVPRHDGDSNAKRLVLDDNLVCVRLLDYFVRELKRGNLS